MPLTVAVDDLRTALVDARAARDALNRIIAGIEGCLEQGVQPAFAALSDNRGTASDHRRNHRSGTAPKIASDPELQAFITARVDCLTFAEIAAEIANHFPPAQHIHPSTIHRWWQRQMRAGHIARR